MGFVGCKQDRQYSRSLPGLLRIATLGRMRGMPSISACGLEHPKVCTIRRELLAHPHCKRAPDLGKSCQCHHIHPGPQTPSSCDCHLRAEGMLSASRSTHILLVRRKTRSGACSMSTRVPGHVLVSWQLRWARRGRQLPSHDICASLGSPACHRSQRMTRCPR